MGAFRVASFWPTPAEVEPIDGAEDANDAAGSTAQQTAAPSAASGATRLRNPAPLDTAVNPMSLTRIQQSGTVPGITHTDAAARGARGPNRPVVALATERIVELSTRKAAITNAIEAVRGKRPAGHHPDEIVAMLDAVPDLRPTIATATDEQLAKIFRAFDVSIL